MRVAVLTREYPPEVYGGAGVHVEHLAEKLASRCELQVHCIGAPRPDAVAHQIPAELAGANPALAMLGVDVAMTAALREPQIAHSHTWYANLAGHLAKLVYGIPHVLTAHSLEPQRPWKAEQLGGGYRVSSWAEQVAYESADAVIAVSGSMRADVLHHYPRVDPATVHVIHNGIDTQRYRPAPDPAVLARYGVDAGRPYVLFVGRITRQKGVAHLLAAASGLQPDIQLVLCAGAPDTPEIATETTRAISELSQRRAGVVWIQRMLPREQVIALLSSATVFVCPSVYEPQGIVNLEAMACGTAVVASAVGGIPEVVVDGRTGVLVPYAASAPESFRRGLAEAMNALAGDPRRAAALGSAGRERAVSDFGWDAIADRTLGLYSDLITAAAKPAA